jgi:hypothetical protein
MNVISFKDIDQVLIPWAKERNLHIYKEYKDEEVRSMIFVDKWGDVYQLYSIPDFENNNMSVAVGADLSNRGDKKHTFFRERREYHFRKSVALVNMASTLDEAWRTVQEWGSNFHQYTPGGE